MLVGISVLSLLAWREMLVLVASSGRSYELDAEPNTLVDIVQRALENLTGVLAAEQVLICGGMRLEGRHALAHYGLPAIAGARDAIPSLLSGGSASACLPPPHVFLFSKALLRGADSVPLPPIELLDDPISNISPPYSDAAAAEGPMHPLDHAPSPLLRALPDYQRRFRYHLAHARALRGCSQERLETARRLVSEQHVQALAIDSARENVEAHYQYIVRLYEAFTANFERHRGEFTAALSRFPEDLARLADVPTFDAARDAGLNSLADCVDAERLRARAEECKASLAHFDTKVKGLAGKFCELQRAVEALMMTGPEVDIAELDSALADASIYVDEQKAILQSLGKDLYTVECMVKEMTTQLLGGGAAAEDGSSSVAALTTAGAAEMPATSTLDSASLSLSPLDNVAALDPMNTLHTSHYLPRLDSCSAHLDALARRCLVAKAAMSAAVRMQLRNVSRLQGRIRDMKRTVTLFDEVMTRQVAAFDEVRAAARAPAAYQACLAECLRRRAFQRHYAARAAATAEALAAACAAEVERGGRFARAQERYLPRALLDVMGLYATPAGCEVSVPAGMGGAYGGALTDHEARALPPPVCMQAEIDAHRGALLVEEQYACSGQGAEWADRVRRLGEAEADASGVLDVALAGAGKDGDDDSDAADSEGWEAKRHQAEGDVCL